MGGELLFKWKTNVSKMDIDEFRLRIRKSGIFRAMRLWNDFSARRAGSPAALKAEPDQFRKVLMWCSRHRQQETKLQELSNSLLLFNVSFNAYFTYTLMYSLLHSTTLH